MKKRILAALLSLAMIFSMCMTTAFAAPPAPPTKEADTYTGPVIDYPDKKLWFDSTIYGGHFSPYQIMKGNGDDTFDIDAFINSKQGELMMSRIKYELALIGNGQWAGEEMVSYWKNQGVIETTHDADDPAHEWITYVPEYMYAEENAGKVYPVVFALHGNGNDLFTSQNLGYVHICYDNGFIVVTPEAENSDAAYMTENLPVFLDKMEAEGCPIDRTRVYVGGMSKGGQATLSIGLTCSDTVAAIAPHSSVFGMMLEGTSIESLLQGQVHTMQGNITQAQLDACGGMPTWLQIGESDMNQLPLAQGAIDSLNGWLAMNDCPTKATATDSNIIGITADKVYTQELDGTTYTFAEFYNTDGVKTMVVVGIKGLPHWVSYSYPQLAWDFMKKYSIVDGKRVYDDSVSATNVVANCHIGAFGQAVDSFELSLDNPSVLNSIQADGFTIENASKFVGMIPCAPYVESVEVKDGKLLLKMGGDEFLLYKSDGSQKGEPLKVTYDKDGIQFSFSYADITADNGAMDDMVEKYFEGMQYFSYEPESSNPLPLVVFLHGGNLAGLQKTALAAVDALVQPEFQAKHPCYVLAPTSMKHLNGAMGWDKEERDQVIALIQSYVSTGKIDANRIYLAGNSMGSGGAINTALENPDLFAAVMPMSGPLRGIAEDKTMQEQFRTQVDGVLNVPFMLVMAKSDPVANYADGVRMYEIMTEKGANVRTTFYEDDQLVESGVIEYTHAADAMAKYDPSLYEWMFAQAKSASENTLTKRDDGFYSYYDKNGQLVKSDYIMMDDGSLYFFNSKGIGVEIDYVKISDHVIQIFDNTNDSAFIVIGDKKAAVIDGMNGTVDLLKIAKFFTDKPLVAVLTHGHGDHTGGVQSFDEVHLNEADFELYASMIAGDFRFKMISYNNYLADTGSTLDYTLVNTREDLMEQNPNLKLIPIEDSEIFDLGGISIECIAAPGHTAGSMAMLIREDRVLVTGDAANKYTQVQGCPVESYLQTLLKLKAREAEYDDIYSSHGALKPDGTNTSHMADTMIDELIEGCESILDGTNEGAVVDPNAPVRWAYPMGPSGRADGKCGNFMFNTNLIRVNEPGTTYTVSKGDTLWGIARKHLGTGTKWADIYEANKDKIKNPNLIYVGQVLVIPAD